MAALSSTTDGSPFFRKLPRELRDKVYSLLDEHSYINLPNFNDYCYSELRCLPELRLFTVNKQSLRIYKEECERDLRIKITIWCHRQYHWPSVEALHKFAKQVPILSRTRHMEVHLEADDREITQGKTESLSCIYNRDLRANSSTGDVGQLWEMLATIATKDSMPACHSLELLVEVTCFSRPSGDKYLRSAEDAQTFKDSLRQYFAAPLGLEVSIKVSVELTCRLFSLCEDKEPLEGGDVDLRVPYDDNHWRHPQNEITFTAKPDEGPHSWCGLALEVVDAGSFRGWEREDELCTLETCSVLLML